MEQIKGRVDEKKKDEIFSKDLFSDFGINKRLLKALNNDNFIKSTEIQKQSYDKVFQGRNCII